MIHHLFSWISYISIFLGVLKIMNHISPTGRPNPNLHSRKANEPLRGCARIVQTNGGGWCSTMYTFLNKLIYPFLKISSVNVYDIRPHWQYHFQDVPKKNHAHSRMTHSFHVCPAIKLSICFHIHAQNWEQYENLVTIALSQPSNLDMKWNHTLFAWSGQDCTHDLDPMGTKKNTSCKLLLPTKWIRAARSKECQTPHPGMVWDATTLVPGQNITMLLTIIP